MGSVLHSIECTCSTCWTEFLSWWRGAMGPHDERVVRHIFETSSSLCVKLFGPGPLEGAREAVSGLGMEGLRKIGLEEDLLEGDADDAGRRRLELLEEDLEGDAGDDARRRRLELRALGKVGLMKRVGPRS